MVEWADLDPRLGIRHSGGWGVGVLPDILDEMEQRLARMRPPLEQLARHFAVALCGPTLPLPPLGHMAGVQASGFELRLLELVTSFHHWAATLPNVRLVRRQRLDELSPVAERFDAKLELTAGFPYRLPHAELVARLLIDTLFPETPKKGLITDLDGTLWNGIVGEVGVEGVCWDLSGGAQTNALYQQLLASLAEHGVLIGVASKNEPALALQALGRQDLLIPESAIFPVEANWGPKSASVARILAAWNIAPDDVVFVDDNPMELAEVQEHYPQMECTLFPKNPDEVWRLLWHLHDRFGKPTFFEEDQLRASSLRGNAALLEASDNEVSADFLSRLGGTLTPDFLKDPQDQRAFELVNKTNQFNLNGRRYTPADWQAYLGDEASFLLRVSYADKFGPLGKIAVLLGRRQGPTLAIDTWVMSCRAFSRCIEHHTLHSLFQYFGAEQIELDYQPTDRNQPLHRFLSSFPLATAPHGSSLLTRAAFHQASPPLPHQVHEIVHG